MAGRRRRRQLPRDPVAATIESVSHEGKGIAYVDGITTFIDGALRDEQVTFRYTRKSRSIAEGVVDEVLRPSPLRVEPLCPHYAICGGCSLQHLEPHQQLLLKQNTLLENLLRIGKTEPQEVLPPLTGPQWGYRRKARLGVRFVVKKDKLLVGFREKHSNFLAQLDRCLVLHPSVGRRLSEIAEVIRSLSVYRQVPQLEVAYGDNRGAFIVRHLEPLSDNDRNILAGFAEQAGINLYLQPGGPESIERIWPPDERFEELCYYLPEYDLVNTFQPADFTQVNALINRQMIHLALELLEPREGDSILDLFCGLGNFTLPMARRAARVTGVEGNNEAVLRARQNAIDNDIDNVGFAVADLFQDVSRMSWARQQYDRILLDPARSGAREIITLLPRFNAHTVVYVSCNPATLARDTEIMVHQNGYKLVKAGVMDMFPHTGHVESIALFKK